MDLRSGRIYETRDEALAYASGATARRVFERLRAVGTEREMEAPDAR